MRVTVSQAEWDLSKLLARAEAGEEIFIVRDGTPIAELVALEAEARRTKGTEAGPSA